MGALGTFGIAVAETRAQCVTSEPLYDILHKGELYKHISADQSISGVVLFAVLLVLIHPHRSVIFRRVRQRFAFSKMLNFSSDTTSLRFCCVSSWTFDRRDEFTGSSPILSQQNPRIWLGKGSEAICFSFASTSSGTSRFSNFYFVVGSDLYLLCFRRMK